MTKYIFASIVFILFSCSIKDENRNLTIVKPTGIYSSSFGNELALDNEFTRGALIRVKWRDIEPEMGVFNFTELNDKLHKIKKRNLKWSLAIIAGGDSPNWLIDNIKASYFEISGIDNTTKRIPKIWDSLVNERIEVLAKKLGETYGNDKDLVLIYVPQMTANGIEGHFNGVSKKTLSDAGLTADNWVTSVKETSKIFAKAFSNKAIAVEVHDIMDDTTIPYRIINDLWNDTSLNHRVGAAMWWISGKTNYQSNLIDFLKSFEGDIYAQVIGRSDQTYRFENNAYSSVFEQAKQLNIRYIEVWEYELINNTFPEIFKTFNVFTDEHFISY